MQSEIIVYYFAYGSNMLESRLKERISAKYIGVGKLNNYQFLCNKKSKFGSAKGNISTSQNNYVLGVLYEVVYSDLLELDKIEGGYKRIEVDIELDEEIVKAFAYESIKTTDELPQKEYLDIIIKGAEEHNLDIEYIKMLNDIPFLSG